MSRDLRQSLQLLDDRHTRRAIMSGIAQSSVSVCSQAGTACLKLPLPQAARRPSR